MTNRRIIDVDITDRADDRVPSWDTASGTHHYVVPSPPPLTTHVASLASDQTIGAGDTVTDATGVSVTCAAGTWIFFAHASFLIAATTGYAGLMIRTGTATPDTEAMARGVTGALNVSLSCFTDPIVLAGSTTYKLAVQMSGTTGKVFADPLGVAAKATRLLAIQVA